MNQKQAQLLATLLRELAHQVELLRDEDIDEIISGAKQIDLKLVPRRQYSGVSKRTSRSIGELQEVILKLHSMQTREEGEIFLKKNYGTKEDLLHISRAADIPVHKKDTVAEIIEKLIEATIGFRIRSAAIQGRDVQRKSDF